MKTAVAKYNCYTCLKRPFLLRKMFAFLVTNINVPLKQELTPSDKTLTAIFDSLT